MIESKLRSAIGSQLCAVEETSAAGSGASQAERMAKSGFDVIVAAGGDGTISDVMQGVLGSASALAVLPLGTGNDFARTLGLLNADDAIAAIARGNRHRIDVGHWRQGTREGHFLNVAGCGFDACVAERINSGVRRLRGQAAYLVAIAQTLRRYECLRLRLEVDGEPMGGPTMLCAIANARSYGGGIRVAPTAELSDGLLDLVLVGEFGRLEFLRSFPLVLRGSHLSHAKVSHRTFKCLTLSSDPPSPFLVDGELLPPGDVDVQVVPSALDVLAP
jgi:diacylglycerol kinase (ATP)